MSQTLQALAEFTGSRLVGDGSLEVAKVASIAQAQPGDLVFVQDEKDLRSALASPASAVIAGEFAAASASSKPLLISAQSPPGVLCRGRAVASAEGVSAGRASYGGSPSVGQNRFYGCCRCSRRDRS